MILNGTYKYGWFDQHLLCIYTLYIQNNIPNK